MTRIDKPKRDEGGAPFRYEYAIPPDEVVRALMRLDRPHWLMIISDIHFEEGAAGYTFEFRQKIAGRMTSEIRMYVWEDDSGRTIIEGVFRKRTLSLSFLFLTTLIIAILSVVFLLTSLVSTPPPNSTDMLFKIIAALNMSSLAATFFYALRYDTAYHVVKALQQLQEKQTFSRDVTGRQLSRLQENDQSQTATTHTNTIWNQTISEYGDNNSAESLHKKL